MECIDDDACGVGECFCLPYIHSPGSQSSGHAGKEKRPVCRQQRQRIDLPAVFEPQLNVLLLELASHLEMRGDLFGGMREQIAAWQAVQKMCEFLARCARGKQR